MEAPRDGLLRAVVRTPLEVRAAGDAGAKTLTGHFAVFNVMTTIDNWYEGRFREQIKPGAFAKTMAERREQIRCIYEHGHDPMFGRKPIGAPDVLTEDEVGAYYEVSLFDTQLNRDHIVLPAEAKQLGASFAFRIMADSWDDEPADGGLPIRTITEVKLYEFGPCPFAAYDEATAGVRSLRSGGVITPELWRSLTADERTEICRVSSAEVCRLNAAASDTTAGTPDTAAGSTTATAGAAASIVDEPGPSTRRAPTTTEARQAALAGVLTTMKGLDP